MTKKHKKLLTGSAIIKADKDFFKSIIIPESERLKILAFKLCESYQELINRINLLKKPLR